jgi:hypothetical protein
MSAPEYDLSITSNAKPFPLGPLAVALYINSCDSYAQSPPIAVKPLPVENVRPMAPESGFELLRKSEYTSIRPC